MGAVIMHSAVSVDGFIADEKDQVGPLFDYYGHGDVHPRQQQASYYFISDVAQAVAKAKELAGERTVAVAGGQAFALGLVDEVVMDVVPVVFGSGKRYFGSTSAQHLLEDPHTVIQGDRVLHLS